MEKIQKPDTYRLLVNGEELYRSVLPAGTRLEARVAEPFTNIASLSLIVTPLNSLDLGKQFKAVEGRKIALGDIPTLVHHKQLTIECVLQDGNIYDLLAFKRDDLKTGGTVQDDTAYDIHQTGLRVVFEESGRFLTKEGNFSAYLPFDALKLFAIEYIGLTMEQAREVQAFVTPISGFGDNGRGPPFQRYLAVFSVKGKDGKDYDVTVSTSGKVNIKEARVTTLSRR